MKRKVCGIVNLLVIYAANFYTFLLFIYCGLSVFEMYVKFRYWTTFRERFLYTNLYNPFAGTLLYITTIMQFKSIFMLTFDLCNFYSCPTTFYIQLKIVFDIFKSFSLYTLKKYKRLLFFTILSSLV